MPPDLKTMAMQNTLDLLSPIRVTDLFSEDSPLTSAVSILQTSLVTPDELVPPSILSIDLSDSDFSVHAHSSELLEKSGATTSLSVKQSSSKPPEDFNRSLERNSIFLLNTFITPDLPQKISEQNSLASLNDREGRESNQRQTQLMQPLETYSSETVDVAVDHVSSPYSSVLNSTTEIAIREEISSELSVLLGEITIGSYTDVNGEISPLDEVLIQFDLPAPIDRRVGDPGFYYIDNEYSPITNQMVYLDELDRIYVVDIDPVTGEILGSNAQGTFVGQGIINLENLVTRPSYGAEWGLSAQGLGIYYSGIDTVGTYQMYRWFEGDEAPTQLTSGLSPKIGVLPTQTPTDEEASLLYVKQVVKLGSSELISEVVIVPEGDPNASGVIVPHETGGTEGPRWIPGEKATVSVADIDGIQQVVRFEVDTQQVIPLTTDSREKNDPKIIPGAPEFGNEDILVTLIEENSTVGVYRDPGASPFDGWFLNNSFTIPFDDPQGRGVVLRSMETFVFGGRSYVVMAVGSIGEKTSSEVWISSLDGSFQLQVSDYGPEPKPVLDPEVKVQDSHVLISYYTAPNSEATNELRVVQVFLPEFEEQVPVINLAELDGDNGFYINGIGLDDFSGRDVRGAGDVNGDGHDDIIIAAPSLADPQQLLRGDTKGETDPGESYVVFGSSRGFPTSFNLASLNGRNGFILRGIDPLDFSGDSVGGAGDVNGDGIGDIIIGSSFADANGQTDAGESYVVFGSQNAFPKVFSLADLDGSNGFVLNGVNSQNLSGASVSGAGDVNNDGIDDIIIGAYFADPRRLKDAGESYVVFGSRNGFPAAIDLASLNGSNGFAISGATAGSLSGAIVSGAGDMNGDGFDDVIIGAPFANPNDQNSAGAAYVVFGSGAGFSPKINLANLNGNNGFVLNGSALGDALGRAVRGAGDFNGDGFDDVIVGADLADPNALNGAGKAFLVFGSGDGFAPALNSSDLDGNNGFVINGIDAFDYAGVSVSGAGDLNGDGFDDIIVGAGGVDLGSNLDAGESYVIFGSDRVFDPSFELADLDSTTGFVIRGIDRQDLSGVSVSGAGDINSDGFDDLIIGALGGDPNGKLQAGESYVIFGKASFADSVQ